MRVAALDADAHRSLGSQYGVQVRGAPAGQAPQHSRPAERGQGSSAQTARQMQMLRSMRIDRWVVVWEQRCLPACQAAALYNVLWCARTAERYYTPTSATPSPLPVTHHSHATTTTFY